MISENKLVYQLSLPIAIPSLLGELYWDQINGPFISIIPYSRTAAMQNKACCH